MESKEIPPIKESMLREGRQKKSKQMYKAARLYKTRQHLGPGFWEG